LVLAQKKQRKEDLIIEKKIRELRGVGSTAEPEAIANCAQNTVADEPGARPRLERVVSWLKRSR